MSLNKFKKTFNKFIKNIDSFDAFEHKIKSLNNTKNKLKGDIFEYFAYVYFKITGLYDYKKFYLYSDIPSNLHKKLNIPEKDKGIDAIIIWNDDTISAIQMKFRSDVDTIIPFGEIATFPALTFGVANGFDYGIMFTNCDDICKELKNKRFNNITRNSFERCNKKFWERCRYFLQTNKIIMPDKKIPYKYQQDIIDLAKIHYNKNNFGRLYAPCGTGKTLMAYWINNNLEYTNLLK